MSAAQRLLRSPLVDLLVGPHGIDRYLELVRPTMTVSDARAEVLSVRHQTARSVTVTLRPNAAWRGFRAGQFVRVGVEIDGIRRTRTYSPASSQHDAELELTVTVHPDGVVSRHLHQHLAPGTVVHLGDAADGEFVLPRPTPERLMLISGGSGVTPLMSMLRTLHDEGYEGRVDFIHFARTAADWLYRSEVEALPNVTARFLATREGGGRLHDQVIDGSAHAAVCGPPALLEAARDLFPPERLLTETFTPPSLTVSGGAAQGTLRFLRSGHEAPVAGGTLLEQAEAAGLTPDFGCRMGICHTCTCRKTAGAVRDMRTGAVSEEEDEDIQLCVSVPAGDVALQI